MRSNTLALALGVFVGFAGLIHADDKDEKTLPGTQPLTWDGDIASRLVEGVDQFLLRKLEASTAGRAAHWKRDTSSAAAYNASVEPNRKRLAHIAGVRDPRVPFEAPELLGTTAQPALVGRGTGFEAFAVRWPAFGDVHGEGLLLVPSGGKKPVADVVAIPDASQTPEQIAGLTPGVAPASQYARRLAESGCRVLIPALIDRGVSVRKLTNREYLYRSAFELGRHLIGYELQKVLAAVDWFAKEGGPDAKIGVFGWGEGGLLALYAGALDTRIDTVGVSGYFSDRSDVWREPVERNVFGLLEQFGDAELGSLVAPRSLIIEAAKGPEHVVPPGTGGAPGRLVAPDIETVETEFRRARSLVAGLNPAPGFEMIETNAGFNASEGAGAFGSQAALSAFLSALAPSAKLAAEGMETKAEALRSKFDMQERLRRQMHEIDRHSQWLLSESPYVRQKFMEKLDTSSLARFQETVEPYRTFFRDEVIGHFDDAFLPANPRTRRIFDEPKVTGYEVVLDVFPDVIAYGILAVPKDIQSGEKRPVVVCQHGLEGRPQDVSDPKINSHYYNQFGMRLAERGFVTFAPQNLYIFTDRFRTLQRKANPLKKTLFSIIVPQHQQITDWLKTLPYVDPTRIGFYGLSYGGKSAMRIPPLVSNYALSICSADFDDWIWQNASTRSPYSYIETGEYEVFEFDLGSTFSHAEMAALIAPRPFMVERGHFDGGAADETVGYEFAKVRFLYEAKLKLQDKAEIEWFDGPHTVHGVGTFDFLHKHLNWPKRIATGTE
jgi:dienelactone hydrolase